MIRVWTDAQSAGVLDRLPPRGSTFAYEPTVAPERAVSLTMPVRVQSWDWRFGLLPVFEMNLPEGALREHLRRRFAKALGSFDEFDLLGVVGRSQIGRIRYTALGETLVEEAPFQSVDEILRARRDGGLFDYLLEQFASHSGLSGVQPKVMIRGVGGKLSGGEGGRWPSLQSATHIVKLWDAAEYPELAANEFFCLSAARAAGLKVPDFKLSDDGGALVIDRFDLKEGGYLGFEDFCVLNGLGTVDKYKGGYERRLFARLKDFVAPSGVAEDLESLFRLFVVNCAIRNGDAHLKNFGLLYASVSAEARLAPVYDLVTTWAYLPKDPMALTLEGSTRWPDARRLSLLGETRAELGAVEVRAIMERTADAMADTAPAMRRYFAERDAELGARILAAWEIGMAESLGVVKGLTPATKLPAEP